MERTTRPQQRSIPPVGYRFHPTDAELVGHFLHRKNLPSGHHDMPIAEIKICAFEPWDLPDQSKIKSNDKIWYFFCPRDFKYAQSRRANRTTKDGYWKPTGKPRRVKAIGSKKVIGTKRTLVFYDRRLSKPNKTKWIMHEYDNGGNFHVCKLKYKSDEKIKNVERKEVASASASASPAESVITLYSSSGECEPRDNIAVESEGHNQHQMTAISTHDNGEQSCEIDFDFGNSDENEVTSNFACSESEQCGHMTSNLEIQNTNEMTAVPIYQNGKFREAFIFKSQNSYEELNILVSKEVEWSPFAAKPDCGNQNLHEKNVLAAPIAVEFGINASPQISIIDDQGPPTFFDDMKTLEGSLNFTFFSQNEN